MNSPLGLINKKHTAPLGVVGPMLTITSLWLMLAVPNTSAQTSNDVSSSVTTASTSSEAVLGVGNVGNLKLKWKETVGFLHGPEMALPVVANGIVYCSLYSNPLIALNASTGATLWTFRLSDGSPVSVVNGIAYFASSDYASSYPTTLYVLDASTGAELWNFTRGADVVSSTFTVASSGVVYVGTSSIITGPGVVDALDASTGAKLWSSAIEGAPVSSAVANGVVYVGTRSDLNGTAGTVNALNADTGAKLWSFATGAPGSSSPKVANGVIYIASNDGTLYALNADTGAKLWAGNSADTSPAVANGVVYVGSTDSTVDALNATTGAKLWTFDSGRRLKSSPAVANGVVYVGTSSILPTQPGSRPGFVYALNASTGAKLWSYSEPLSLVNAPLFSGINVVDGVVYVSVVTGIPDAEGFPIQDVYAFSLGADLLLRAQPSTTTVHQGDLLTYTFPVWNLGPDAAVHEMLDTQVPAGTTFDYIRISGTPGLSTCTTPKYLRPGQILCHENASMAPNTTWTVRVTVKVTAPSGTVITENAATLADTSDQNMDNNTATVSVKVQ